MHLSWFITDEKAWHAKPVTFVLFCLFLVDVLLHGLTQTKVYAFYSRTCISYNGSTFDTVSVPEKIDFCGMKANKRMCDDRAFKQYWFQVTRDSLITAFLPNWRELRRWKVCCECQVMWSDNLQSCGDLHLGRLIAGLKYLWRILNSQDMKHDIALLHVTWPDRMHVWLNIWIDISRVITFTTVL